MVGVWVQALGSACAAAAGDIGAIPMIAAVIARTACQRIVEPSAA
jgi:hypothetical protein